MSLLANLFLVVGTVVFLLYGAADTVHAAAASGKKVTLAYSSLGSLQTAMWMAKETKVYEKYGLEADLIYISSGPTVIQALLGNDLQGGLAATNALIAAAGRGAPLVDDRVECALSQTIRSTRYQTRRRSARQDARRDAFRFA